MSSLSTIFGSFRSLSRVSLSAVLIAVVLMSTGCSNPFRPVEVRTTTESVETPNRLPVLPRPPPLDLADPEWTVVTPDRLPEGDNWVYYGVTPEGYGNLARNMAELMRWAQEMMWRLNYYENKGQNQDGSGNTRTPRQD